MYYLDLLISEIKLFTNLRNKMYQFLLFFQPLIFLSILYFLSMINEDVNTSKFIITSSIISMFSYVLYSSGSALVSQKWSGTLMLLIAAPISLFHLLTSKILANSYIALISMGLSFIYGKFIFNFDIQIPNIQLFLIGVLVFIYSLSSMGLVFSILFVTFQRVFDYQNFIQIPLLLISGIFISVESFPVPIQLLANLLPMTWGIKVIYGSLTSISSIGTTIIITLFVSTLYIILSKIVVEKMEKVLRITGKWGAI